MRTAASAEGIGLNVLEGDVCDAELPLLAGRYRLVVLSEVMTHFRNIEDVRAAFTKFADALVPGGLVVLNAFLTAGAYVPDSAAREVAQTAWSSVFTRADLEFICHELPFDRISDECAYEFEKTNVPPDAWPPTGWFESWSRGQNIFDLPPGKGPAELRWLVYRRR